MPPDTIEAFRDHGTVTYTLEKDVEEAQLTLDNLVELGIDLDEVTEQLQKDGVEAFAKSFNELMKTLEEKMAALYT
jgi:transaldolase